MDIKGTVPQQINSFTHSQIVVFNPEWVSAYSEMTD